MQAENAHEHSALPLETSSLLLNLMLSQDESGAFVTADDLLSKLPGCLFAPSIYMKLWRREVVRRSVGESSGARSNFRCFARNLMV